VTIVADGVPRGQILEALRTKYHVEVKPVDKPDERISLRLADLALDEALVRLLPAGSHYVTRIGAREITAGPAPFKEKTGANEERGADLPAKDRPRAPSTEPERSLKPDPARWQEPPPRAGRGQKPLAQTVPSVGPSRGPKIAKTGRTPERTARFTFVIRSDGTVRVASAAMVEGSAPESQMVRGPFLFGLGEPNGPIVYFGSLPDPLEEHSYQTDGTHGSGRAPEGTFGIWIPATLVDASRLGPLELSFYDARDVTLPRTLDQESFQRAAGQAKRLARVPGSSLLRAFAQGRQ
jgi:hypothetical protein